MGYIQDLVREHSRFSAALDDARNEAETIRRQRSVRRGTVMEILSLFLGPTGVCHFDKERLLFRQVSTADPDLARTASRAIDDSTRGRDYLRRVAHYLDSAVRGDPASMAEVAENLLEAEKILRSAINLEENCLTRSTQRLEDSGRINGIEKELEEVVKEHRGKPSHVSCHSMAGVLWA